jgi:hypothetical protein
MATPTFSQLQREYWVKRPADVLQFFTVEFSHPDFGFVRLVQDQFSSKIFDVSGTPETFTGASMQLPMVTNQETDSTKAGTITFGRIGLQFRQTLLQITPLGAITDPITVRLRQYQDGTTLPVYERRLYVARNGISIGSDNVSVKLTVDNPAILSEETQFYDPDQWPGLQSI